MALLLLFPVIMIATVIAVALSADNFQSARERESDFHQCCGAQKYEILESESQIAVEERKLIAA